MRLMELFSIKQKLAILFLFLTCAVSFLAFNAHYYAQQNNKNNLEIEIVQQQKLLIEKFINAIAFITQQANATDLKTDYSKLTHYQLMFDKNLSALTLGGEIYHDLDSKMSVNLMPDFDDYVKIELKKSEKVWDDLQTFSQILQQTPLTINQLSTVQLLTNNLQNMLSNITTTLIEKQSNTTKINELVLYLSCAFILILACFLLRSIAKTITQPLENLSNTASRIGSGDLQSYLENNKQPNELQSLTNAVDATRIAQNNLIIKIQEHSKQLHLSSSQLDKFFNEMNGTQQLQFNQISNVESQLDNLQKNTELGVQLLSQYEEFNIATDTIITNIEQNINKSVNSLEEINNNYIICNENINNLQQNAISLNSALTSFEILKADEQQLPSKIALTANQSNKDISSTNVHVLSTSKHISSKIKQITPIFKRLQSQVDYLPTPLKHIEVQVHNLQHQLIGLTELFNSLQHEVDIQNEKSAQFKKQNKQQETQISLLHKTVESALILISENQNRSKVNSLFIEELEKTSQRLNDLSADFVTEKVDAELLRNDDKRLYPRISQQIKVSLQQADKSLEGITQDISLSGLQMKSLQSVVFSQDRPVTFSIVLPSPQPQKNNQVATLFCDIVHFERIDDVFYYRISFHSVSQDSKTKIQQIFDYFDKTSEFVF